MYHIFFSFFLIASQKQINQTQKYFEQQKKHSNKITQTTKENPKQDIIMQLKQEAELEEKSLVPDLESLGLDLVESFVSTAKSMKSDLQTSEPKTSALPAISLLGDGVGSGQKIKTNDKAITLATSDQIILEPSPPLQQSNAANVIANIDQATNANIKKGVEKSGGKNIGNVVNLEPKNKEKQAEELVPKPIDKTVVDGIKILPENQEQKLPLPIEDSKGVVIDTNASKAKPNLVAKNQEKINKAKKKQISLTELKQKQKTEKLEIIRQKYLQNSEEDGVYEGINRYQIINKIVTRGKIPPKFINSELPPPLLNRFRGEQNKNHPIIMSNSEKIDFMFKAIAENKIDEFNSLYSKIKDPNIKNSLGDSLLTFAILMRRYDAMFSLLSKGANPDLANDLGYTPLNIAIEMVDYGAASILIDMGANVNLIDDLGRTYLMQSARVGSLQITDLLISKGVDVNIADKNGNMALEIAYKHKKDIIAKYLLKYGAKSWIKKSYNDDETSVVEDLFEKWK